MAIRITGMNSGLDTESIISELVKAKSTKKDSLVKAQTKLQWKQDAWKELNTKVYTLYSKTLSNMRLQGDYYKKTTKVSNSNAASVITGANAVNGVQTLKIDKLAKSGYLTGAELTTTKTNGDGTTTTEKAKYDSSTKLGEMGITFTDGKAKIDLEVGGKDKGFEITANMTVNDLVNKFKDAGLNASFDAKNQRFFISSKETGAAGNFDITGDAAKVLGLKALTVEKKAEYEQYCKYDENSGAYVVKDEYKDGTGAIKAEVKAAVDKALDELNAYSYGATKIDGQDAEITLNGAKFTSSTNTFQINGLTITANTETDEEFTITTENDTDGIYDMIKNFFKEYNTLINEMDSLYNADSTKGYEPLTDEEKEAMSEKEIEKWEEKIKDSILRKDSTLSSVASAMKSIMAQGIDMKDEKGNPLRDAKGNAYGKLYLSDFGINTLGYFTAKDNEKGAYHIDGDPDDTSTSGNGDKLKTAIANDPDKVVAFFTQLSKNLYEKLGDMMKKTDYSSSFTLYDDVSMKEEYDDYTSKIKTQEQKITDFEDRYYKKFSAMETALAKLSSKESAISGLLGM